MGTIAEKLSYLNDTKGLFKDRLNSLGAEITSSTTFRNYLTWLDTFYGEVSDKTDLSVNGVVGRTSQDALLPSEYTQVDYIESSGTQYIDTGVNADYKLDVKYKIEKTGNSLTAGAIYNNNNNHTRYHIGINNNKYSFYILNNSTFGTIPDDTNVKHEFYIKATNRTVLVDGVTYELPIETSTDTNLNFWFFRRNSNATNLRNFSSFKLYSCSMYYDNELVRDFIPCYRNSDNEVGLYDLVNDVFYTNQGTGAFTYGSVVTIPNPDYPQPINNLSGDVPYKISGKNLFNVIDFENDLVSGKIKNNNGIEVSDNTSQYSTYFIPVIANQPYYFDGYFQRIYLYNSNKEWVGRVIGSSGTSRMNTSYTPTINGYIQIQIHTLTYNSNKGTEIISLGSTATTYEPYISQTFNIPLGDIELGKITTYEDKIYSSNGRFYLKKNIGKVIFNGSETWNLATNFWTPSIEDYAYSNNIPYSNYFKGVINQQVATSLTEDNTFAFKNRSGEPRLYLKSSSFTTTTEFKNWLSTHKPIVYYALATPTTTEITSSNYPTLYNALKQIQDYLTAYKINKEFILGYSSPEIEY